MNPIQHNGEIRRLVQQSLKVLDGIFLAQVQPKLLLDLFMYVSVLDVWDIGVDHKGDQVEDEIGALPENAEGGKAVVLEAHVVRGLRAAHAIDHLFTNFNGWWERFGISSEDVAEVDMEEVTCMGMSIVRPERQGPAVRAYHQVQ
jgi:hypothetical protein